MKVKPVKLTLTSASQVRAKTAAFAWIKSMHLNVNADRGFMVICASIL